MKKTITHFMYLSMLMLTLLHTRAIAQTGCHGLFVNEQQQNTLTVNFDDTSTSPNPITSWQWSFGDGHSSTEQNPSHTYAHDGVYEVCLTIHDNHGCSDTYCHHITVAPVSQTDCEALFSFLQEDQTFTIDFTDLSTSAHTIITWSWDFGDGNSSDDQNPSHTYGAAGTFEVCLNIADNVGCTTHICHEVIVHHPPAGTCHAAFDALQPDQDFPVIDFTDLSTSEGNIGSWVWDFGDNSSSTEQNPTHTYGGPGTYLVCLYTTDDDGICTSHICHEIVVHHPAVGHCEAVFAAHQTDPNQTTIDFTDQSTSDGTIGAWSWDFGDGNSSTEQNPSHTYDVSGTYLVCLYITDDDEGCTSHFCHEIVVHHPGEGLCHAAFSAHQTDPNQFIIDFTDQSTSNGTIGTWSWNFGDGNTSTDQNPSHTYDEPGTYLVCLSITDDDEGCTSHVCHEIVVHHPAAGTCHAAFAALQTDPNQLVIDFTDQSTSTGTIGYWLWDFGDGNTSDEQSPSHTYNIPGTYLVCLFITDTDSSCTSHACHHITVHHPPADEQHGSFSRASENSGAGSNFSAPVVPHDNALVAQIIVPGKYKSSDESFVLQEYIVNYPNPFISSTTIQYQLSRDADVEMTVYDLFGKSVYSLSKEKETAGIYTRQIAGDYFLPGTYLIKMVVGQQVFSKKIVVMK